jgi:hypothetical protein
MSRNARPKVGWVTWSFVLAVVMVITGIDMRPCAAESPGQVLRIEEDWELVVATPDPGSVAPQVSCAISPLNGVDGLHATFELNSQSLATFNPGGLQLQVWNGETAVAASHHPEYKVLDKSNETITWTCVMRIGDGEVVFRIKNGVSDTWGTFGNNNYLRLIVPSDLADLNGYQPASSVENSGVSYAGNRVVSLKRLAWRAYADTWGQDEVFSDDAPVVVHSIE